MALHPGKRKRYFPEEAQIAWDPIRRDLEQNDDWYRDLVEHSQDLLCVHDLDGRLLSVNPVPARLLGYSVAQLLKKRLVDIIDPRFREKCAAYLREITETGESRGLVAVMTRFGEHRVWEYHNTLRTEGVEIPIVRGIAHDVTDRVQAEKTLRRTNKELEKVAQQRERILHELALFRKQLDQSNDSIEVVDPVTLRFLDANETAYTALGYSHDELLSMSIFDIDPTVDEKRAAEVQKQLDEVGFASIQGIHQRKDGTTFPVEVNMRRVHLDREYNVAVARDITQRKKSEERLHEFERVVESLDEMVVVIDRQYRYVIANRAFLKYRKMKHEEVIGRSAAEVLNPLVFENVIKEKLDECFRGQIVSYDLTYDYPGIGNRDLLITYLPIQGAAGIDRAACILRDVTERNLAEKALRESVARERARAKELETVLDTVPLPVYMAHDPECRHVTGNRAAYEHLHVAAGRNISKSAFPKEHLNFKLMQGGIEIPPDLLPMQQAAATRQPLYGRALTMLLEDGTKRETIVNAVPLLDVEGETRGAVGAIIDVTELKQAEEACRASELRFRTVFERSPVGIVLMDSRNGKFLKVNRRFCEIAGRTEDELLAINVASITHPDDVELSRQYLSQLSEDRVTSYELEKRYVRPDGSVRWTRILTVPLWKAEENDRWHMSMVEDVTERRQAEQVATTLVQDVRADSSESFFTSMAFHLAKCLEADYAIIGELIRGQEDKIRTIGLCGHGVMAQNFDRDLAGTPCQTVLEKGTCSFATGVTEIFPDDRLLKDLKAQAYAGTPLRDSQGRVIGIMTALYNRPLKNTKFVEMILQLFSSRTGSEIERKRTEEALRKSEERLQVAIKHAPIAVFNQDLDLRYTWTCNSYFPWRSTDTLGKTPVDLFDAKEAARIAGIRRRVLETGVGVRHEVQTIHAGKKYYLDTTIEPVFDPAGAVIGLTGASIDVTELRETTEALREAKKRLTEEKLYLEQEIDTELGFRDIIGESKALKEVMEHVGKVASSNATVLLLGETGTGKELVARAIHRLSHRANNSFIKLNCAAIPSGLLESELFGNEKGAFTGAVSKKIGRLELADKGTLLLDEIGEISLMLQPKLLRVLQDQEFERLGGNHTLKVDFRLIAATNRDLADSVRANEFRSDLYYRLNVFPIRVPPLRERREDIPILVEHFVAKCSKRMNKSITSIPTKTMRALTGWDWPGNVRELENFIERSVILTQGSVLVSPLSELCFASEDKVTDETLEFAEREHILHALRESRGQIGGQRGAASRLGLKRTTLQSKMKQLGISSRDSSRN